MSDCNNNCPEKTSDITLFDGTFNNITVPDGSSLNDVLTLLETYFTNQINGIETSYTLESDSACLGLTAGTYSLQQMVQAIITKVCENATNIQDIYTQLAAISLNVNTTDVTLDGISLPSCASGFAGTTSTDLFNYILTELCSIQDGINFDPVTDDANSNSANYKAMSEVVRGMVDNNYVFKETTPTTSATSFSSNVEPIGAIVNGYYVNVSSQYPLTLNANEDAYVNLKQDGTYVLYQGSVGFLPPAFPVTEHNLYMFRTDGAGVVSLAQNYNTDPFNPTPLGTDDVDTINIRDGAVTSVKLDDVVVGDTKGSSAIIEVTYNNKGQITGATSNLNIGAITNGQGIKYNAGTLGFEPVDILSINTSAFVPLSDGFDLTDSSISENANQVKSSKKVEINESGTEDDSDALLNLASTDKYFRIMRMTAAEAGLLPLNDAAMIYVTTTDVTFTSVGFWGVESGAWIKL